MSFNVPRVKEIRKLLTLESPRKFQRINLSYRSPYFSRTEIDQIKYFRQNWPSSLTYYKFRISRSDIYEGKGRKIWIQSLKVAATLIPINPFKIAKKRPS